MLQDMLCASPNVQPFPLSLSLQANLSTADSSYVSFVDGVQPPWSRNSPLLPGSALSDAATRGLGGPSMTSFSQIASSPLTVSFHVSSKAVRPAPPS